MLKGITLIYYRSVDASMLLQCTVRADEFPFSQVISHSPQEPTFLVGHCSSPNYCSNCAANYIQITLGNLF